MIICVLRILLRLPRLGGEGGDLKVGDHKTNGSGKVGNIRVL